MKTIKKLILLSSFAVVPMIVFGANIGDAQALTRQEILNRIADLRTQIAELQRQLSGSDDLSRPWCFAFNRNLRYGDSGRDFEELKTALSKAGVYTGQSTRFDEQMASAVVEFQEKFASEILAPSGLRHGTGYVGPATRAVLNRLYRCDNTSRNDSPVISGVSGPTVLNVGQTGTWTINARDPENRTLSYSVIWGDEPTYYRSMLSPFENTFTQTAQFTHVYQARGTYNVKFYVRDNTGNTARSELTVSVR